MWVFLFHKLFQLVKLCGNSFLYKILGLLGPAYSNFILLDSNVTFSLAIDIL